LQPKHELKRIEEEYEDNFFGSTLSALSYLYPKKKRKITNYWIKQNSELPNTALIFDLKGDGKCVPNVKVLMYLIPLQITICALVSAFKVGWAPFNSDIDLICHSYQILKPNDSIDKIKEICPFSSNRIMKKIDEIVSKRVNQLEKELNESKKS